MDSVPVANDPACETRIDPILPDAISNEKFRCQEKLFSHRGFDCAGRQAESLSAGQGLKLHTTQPECVEAVYNIVIIIKLWQSHYLRLD